MYYSEFLDVRNRTKLLCLLGKNALKGHLMALSVFCRVMMVCTKRSSLLYLHLPESDGTLIVVTNKVLQTECKFLSEKEFFLPLNPRYKVQNFLNSNEVQWQIPRLSMSSIQL